MVVGSPVNTQRTMPIATYSTVASNTWYCNVRGCEVGVLKCDYIIILYRNMLTGYVQW